MSKRWKDILTHPNYRVSEDGEIVNKKTGRILKQCDNSSGYPTVNLYEKGQRKTTSVHRIVAEAFSDCPNNKDHMEINHINGDKHCNKPDNLEWVTRGENESHAYRTGLKRGPKHRPVRVIESGEVFASVKACARAIDGFERNITRCLNGENNRYMGLTFEYATDEDVNTRENDSMTENYISRRPYAKSVRIIETGEIFPSIRECARVINGDQGTISACLSGHHKTHKGYHYEYVN